MRDRRLRQRDEPEDPQALVNVRKTSIQNRKAEEHGKLQHADDRPEDKRRTRRSPASHEIATQVETSPRLADGCPGSSHDEQDGQDNTGNTEPAMGWGPSGGDQERLGQ